MKASTAVSPDRADLVYGPGEVDAALARMAADITRDLAGSDPLVLAVMIGGLMPTAWLLERLAFPLQLDYVHATRYRGGTRGGVDIEWLVRPRASLAHRPVLVVDDVLDEGYTLAEILAECRRHGADTVRSAVLVEKQRRAPRSVQADYVGLRCDDRYLFGCGMDLYERHRQHRSVYALPADEA
jgi:hypoxanthine phosphoribosyltransferase